MFTFRNTGKWGEEYKDHESIFRHLADMNGLTMEHKDNFAWPDSGSKVKTTVFEFCLRQ